jgi:hypothetical protein
MRTHVLGALGSVTRGRRVLVVRVVAKIVVVGKTVGTWMTVVSMLLGSRGLGLPTADAASSAMVKS